MDEEKRLQAMRAALIAAKQALLLVLSPKVDAMLRKTKRGSLYVMAGHDAIEQINRVLNDTDSSGSDGALGGDAAL